MATTNTASPSRFTNRPRFTNVPPVTGDPSLFASVCAALGGQERLIALIKAFVKARYAKTGWRLVKDITSRDTKHAASAPNTPATEMLDVPFTSLTSQLAAIVARKTEGSESPIKMSKDESLSVIAVLRDDEAALKAAGIKIWNDMNTAQGYVTMGLSALPAGEIPQLAFEQAEELEF